MSYSGTAERSDITRLTALFGEEQRFVQNDGKRAVDRRTRKDFGAKFGRVRGYIVKLLRTIHSNLQGFGRSKLRVRLSLKIDRVKCIPDRQNEERDDAPTLGKLEKFA